MKPYKEVINEINATLAQVSKILDKKVQSVSNQSQESQMDLSNIQDPDQIREITQQREISNANDSEELQKHFVEFETISLKMITELHETREELLQSLIRKFQMIGDEEPFQDKKEKAILNKLIMQKLAEQINPKKQPYS